MKNIIPEKELIKITNALENDGVIAFPTDTVWGVGCVVEKPFAVDKIFQLKGRDRNKPLILLGSKLEHLLPYIETLPAKAEELVKKYLPGALTIVLKRSLKTPDYITSGYDTVGIRIPANPVLLEILEKTSKVLATTSANLSGEGAFSRKEDVLNSIGAQVDYIADDYGFTAKGIESTVVFVDNDNKIKILRQGAVEL